MNQVKLRRYQNLLIVSGTGVIIFGLWSVIKGILIFLTQTEYLIGPMNELPKGAIYRIILFGILAFFMGGIIFFRLFVGLSARSLGFGKKNRWLYLVFAFIMLLIALLSIVHDVRSIIDGEDFLGYLVSLIVDVTSGLTLLEMIVASFMVKRLRKLQKEG